MHLGNWVTDWGVDEIDLSNMKSLETISLSHINFKSLKLPDNVKSVTIQNCGSFPNLSNLTNLTYLNYSKGDSNDKFKTSNIVESLSSKSWNDQERITLELTSLDELTDLGDILTKFNAKSLIISNCKNVSGLTGIENMVNLQLLKLRNNSGLISLAGLRSLNNLQTIYMNNCAVSSISELEGKTSLNYIDLQNSVFDGNESLQILAGLREKNPNLKLYLKRLYKYIGLVTFTGIW